MDRCHQSTHNWQHIFKHKRASCASKRQCPSRIWMQSGNHRTMRIRVSNRRSKIHRYYSSTSRNNWWRKRCSFCIHTRECVGCTAECTSFRQRNAIQYRYCSFVIVIQLTGDKKNKDPVGALKMQIDGRPLAGLSWERTREDVLTQHLEKSEQLGCLYFYRKAKLFLPVDVDDINMVACKER